MKQSSTRLKYACYSASATMSVVGNLSPVLFLTFRSLYGISYSLLGLLVLINFVTQLSVDLIFSFFSHKFNISKTIKSIPMIATLGFLIYAIWPYFFAEFAYAGLVAGTVIFSAASGLSEVLISPVIAAIPSDDPDREMSKLHSVYAWGTVAVIVVSTLFLLLFGGDNWQLLALLLTLIPVVSAFLFFGIEIPNIEAPKGEANIPQLIRNGGVWICVFSIFLGGAAECTMAQWSSGYLETALGIPKIWGDLFGVALFAVSLALGRSLYAKIGKNIGRCLTLGAALAALCYLIAAISDFALLGLAACALTGFGVSMLWPGNLVVASGKFPNGGVFIYAMMAAGGDLGASVGPQLVGIITDAAIASPTLSELARNMSLTPDQLGMKMGMLCGMLFPLVAIFVNLYLWRSIQKDKATDNSD